MTRQDLDRDPRQEDERILEAYRAAGALLDEQPSRQSRMAILAAAARAVDARPQRMGFNPFRRAGLPFAVAATLLICAVVVLVVGRGEPPVTETTIRESTGAVAVERSAPADETAADVSISPAAVRKTAPVQAEAKKEAQEESTGAATSIGPAARPEGAAAPLPARDRPFEAAGDGAGAARQTQPSATSERQRTAEAFQAKGALPGEAVTSAESASRVGNIVAEDLAAPAAVGRGAAATRAETSPAPADTRTLSKSDLDVASAKPARTPRSAPPSALPAAAPPAPAPLPADRMAQAAPTAPTHTGTGAGSLTQGQAAYGSADRLDATEPEWRATPQRWLDKVLALRAEGRHPEAEVELKRLRERYPEFPLPTAATTPAPR